MRYYRIVFTGANAGKQSDLILEYSSITQGAFGNSNNPAALEIEFDLLLANLNNISQGATLKIRNVPIKTCIIASQYTGMDISIYAGFSDGTQSSFSGILPIDYGLPIAYGQVLACVPNYVGTEMNIDFLITHNTYGNVFIEFAKNQPGFTFVWRKGQDIVEAITNTLKIVDSSVKVSGKVDSRVLTNEQITQVFTDIGTFSQYLQVLSQNIISPKNDGSYAGIKLAQIGQHEFYVYDNSVPGDKTIELKPYDFIGQPLIFAVTESSGVALGIQATVVLRGDMALNKFVKFPNVSSTSAPFPAFNNQQKPLGVSGRTAMITQVRHIGKFRSSQADQWATVITCVDPKILEPNQT